MSAILPEVLIEAGPSGRRGVLERLRDGVLDTLVVRGLTMDRERLSEAFEASLVAPSHLVLRGAYGQGKTHGLMVLAEEARARGYATSVVSLDPRVLPFHHMARVYRAAMVGLELPGESDFVKAFQEFVSDRGDLGAVLPESMPARFRLSLQGLSRQTVELSARQRRSRKHGRYEPRTIPQLLRRSWQGEPVPLHALRRALRYRAVEGVGRTSLAVDPEGWRAQFVAVSALLRAMGFAGWVLLFDEAESIAQLRVNQRRACAAELAWWCGLSAGPVPIFAATDDLFATLAADDGPLDPGGLRTLEVGDLAEASWERLQAVLIALHGESHGWTPAATVAAALRARHGRTGGFQTRLRLKALVDELDLQYQAVEGA